jgi:hypothetical protein
VAALNPLRHVRNETRRIRVYASSVSIAAGSAWLIHRASRHNTPCGVCGIGVVNHPVRVRTAASYANEYLDFRVKDRIGGFDPFEPQFAIAAFAAQGQRRLDEVTHVRPPFVRHPS